MLSAISSTHLDSNPTFSPSRYPKFTDFAIKSEIVSQEPLPNAQTGPTLEEVSTNPVIFRTSTPIQLPDEEENSIMVTILAKHNNYVAKAECIGSIDAFCKPLLEYLDSECLGCKIYVRGVFIGSGEVLVHICEGFEEVCEIKLEFIVITPPENAFGAQATSLYGVSRMYDTFALQQHQNATQHSETPATYYNESNYENSAMPEQSGLIETPIYNAEPHTLGFNAPTVDICAAEPSAVRPGIASSFKPYNEESEVVENNVSERLNRTETMPSELAETRTHDLEIHVPNDRIEQSHNELNKIIRVLPSDAIIGPADSLHPAKRPIRIRNVSHEDLEIKCMLIGRKYAGTDEIANVVDCTGQAFRIVENETFTLRRCSNPDTEIIADDVIIEFEPNDKVETKWLHSAKLVIEVTGDEIKKSFEVPMLGIFGQADIEARLHGNSGIIVHNMGNCPVFCRCKAVLVREHDAKNALAAPFALDTESIILEPGERENIRMSSIEEAYNQSTDEKACIEVRYGHEALRLLALASDGKGPWKGIYEVLKIKDDVLRIMGGCIELISVDIY